jgi:hypothetical protein
VSKAPIKKFKYGKVVLALWEWENEVNGKKSYSFSIDKSYKDKNGQWQNTSNLYETDLRDLSVLLSGLLAKKIKEYDDCNNQPPQQAAPKPAPQPEPDVEVPF